MKNYAQQVRDIFGEAAYIDGFVMDGHKGLQIAFDAQPDLAKIVQEVPQKIYRSSNTRKWRTIPTLHYFHENLFDLVNDTGVIVLRNAVFNTWAKAKTSSESIEGDEDVIIQDPFHRDWLGLVDKGFPFVTALFKDHGLPREAPTYYAMADDVRQAVRQLIADYDDQEIKDALTSLLHPDFSFGINPSDNEVREFFKHYLPDLTRDLFERISAERRYAHTWCVEEDTVVIHSNTPNGMLHGRPKAYCPSRTLKGATIGASIEPRL